MEITTKCVPFCVSSGSFNFAVCFISLKRQNKNYVYGTATYSVVCIVRSFVVWSFTLKVVGVLFTCLAEKNKWFIEENCTTITVIIVSKGRYFRGESF